MNDITKKLKDVLTVEDQKALDQAIEVIVEEKTAKQVALLVEEEKANLNKASTEYVEKLILEETEKLKQTLTEEFEEKKAVLEENYVEKLNDFLEHEISEHITEEAIEKIAINETYQPVVEGIKKLFSEQGLELDSEGSTLLKEAHEEIVDLKADVSRLMEENIELNKLLEKMSIRDIINTKCEGMIPEQKERVVNMFEGKSFDEVESKIDSFVDLVLESKQEDESEINKNNDLDREGDKIITEDNKTENGSALDSVNSILSLFS